MTSRAARRPAHMTAADPRRRALLVLCLGFFMIVLDATVVNVALPAIQDDLGFAQADLAWVVNAYLVAFGGLLLLAGRLGDLIGRRTVFVAGLVLFTAASAACGLASSAEALVAARFLQGAGGALTSAVVLGLIVTMYPEPREQAAAIGVYGFVASGGGAVGLLVGGVLTEAISWHWIFYVNVPIGIATIVAARRVVPRDAGLGLRAGADAPGAVLVTAALMLGVVAIAETHLAAGAASAVLLAAFLRRQARAATPLVPLSLFRNRTLAAANVVQVLAVPGMFGMFFLGALYLQRVLGFDALEVGLAFLPVTVAMGWISVRWSAPLAERFGALRLMVTGLALIVAGLVVFARVPVDGAYWPDVLPVMLLLGAGAGLAFPPMAGLAMHGVAPDQAGLASGVVNTGAQVGGALGLAVLATAATARTEALGGPLAEALTSGYRLAFVLAAVLVAASIAVALALLRPREAACPGPSHAVGAEA
jgi:EmrB/QacA subfamily drug resistance transporter